MSRRKRSYRSAIVVTVAMSAGASCGGTTTDDETGGTGATGGNVSTGGQSTGGSSTGGSSSGGRSTGATHAGGQSTGGTDDIRYCVIDELAAGMACDQGDECFLEMDCTSGLSRTMHLHCGNGYGWSVVETECETPFEQCRATFVGARCDGENWFFDGGGGNPPAPCPLERPDEGSTCRFGYGFGADPPACGYPCADDGWTIVGCESDDPEPAVPSDGAWTSDGACSPGGAGGEAP